MTPEPSAYLYEFKVVPIEGAGWEERVGLRHPDDLGFTGSESLDFRNVRPLYANEPVEDSECVEVDKEDLRLVLDLAKAARNPRNGVDITPHIGGSARANAARQSHDRLRNQLRDVDNSTEYDSVIPESCPHCDESLQGEWLSTRTSFSNGDVAEWEADCPHCGGELSDTDNNQ